MKLLLDAAFVIDYLRGLPEAVARFARIFELGDEPLLESFLQPIEFIQPGPDVAVRAGAWRAAARRRGLQLSLSDALIAAATDAVGAAVLTRNIRDFALTPVRVETY